MIVISHVAHFISNWTNYALAGLLLVSVVLWRDARKWTFLCASIAAIALSVELAEIGKQYLLYPHHGGFPSGHETFAVSTLTCLTWLNRRWLWLAVPAAVIMAFALVFAHYHSPVDVAGAIVISPLTTSIVLSVWLCFFRKPVERSKR